MATKKVNIDIIAKDKSKQALNKVRGNLDSVKKSIFNLRNAFIGLGAGLVIKSLVKTGNEIENLQVRLKFLFGTAEEGAKAFDNMAKFASKVPFSLAEIQQGAGVLAVVSKDADELAKVMELTGNVAAVTGLDFKTTAEQIQRSLSAGIGAADLFRDRGVKAMLGFKAGAKVSIEETVEAFDRVFGAGGKFAGATDELAKTFEGTLSMIGDKIFNFKRTILEEGFFPELKKQFKDLDNFLENESQLLDEIATKIGKGLAIALRSVGDAFKFVKDNADSFALAIQGLIALKVATVFYGMTTALAGLTVGMKAFNFATKKNIIFGSMLVFAGALGFVITKFREFKGELIESKTPMADLNKEIARLEKLLNNPKVAGTQLKEQLKFARLELARLKQEWKDSQEVFNPHKGWTSLNIEETKELANTYDFLTRNLGDTRSAWQKASTSMGVNTSMLSHNKQKVIDHVHATDIMAKKLEQVPPILQKQFHAWNSIRDIMKDVQIEVENTDTMFGSFKKGFKEAMDTDVFVQFEELGKKTFNSFSDTLANALVTGKFAFQDFARSIILDISKIIAKQMVMLALQKAMGFFSFGGFSLGGLFSFAGGKAEGGQVSSGKSYMVGEQGPEMFVPNQNGNIVPNHDLGKAVTVNFNINTVDARGFNELLVNSRGVIVNMINSAVNEKGRQAII
jgi:hypothetical protein